MNFMYSKFMMLIIATLLFLTSCWTDDYTNNKEMEFIAIQNLMFEDNNADYKLQIRNSGENKPLKWFGTEQSSKYNSIRSDGNNVIYVSYKLETIISTFGAVPKKDIDIESDIWGQTNFYVIFENKNNVPWKKRNDIILKHILEICNLSIDTIKSKIEVFNIDVNNEVVLNSFKSNDDNKASICQYSKPNFEFSNSTLIHFADYINEVSNIRYQYIGSDDNKYTFSISSEGINDIEKYNIKLNKIGLCATMSYDESLLFVIKDL